MSSDTLYINIDGGSRGNPGPAAFGIVIQDRSSVLEKERGYLGHATNNIAEYSGLIRALTRALERGAEHVHIRSDSELLVKQMNGVYRVKNEGLSALFELAKQLRARFKSCRFEHVYREKNKAADALCNEALDAAERTPIDVTELARALLAAPSPPATQAADSTHDSLAAAPAESPLQQARRLLHQAAQSWGYDGTQSPTLDEVLAQLQEFLGSPTQSGGKK